MTEPQTNPIPPSKPMDSYELIKTLTEIPKESPRDNIIFKSF